ncbi:MAG: hypothetical protein A3E87_05865 [Gammaproteobacteria bacterium RIFCSPHIGHO2_12_FULL_35_23]|nr:MAG: hypothetical protein A3E87_05865 [Gammaproteobacteria bacterium RIFCSPHIGHO2_12_FULL_35_23]
MKKLSQLVGASLLTVGLGLISIQSFADSTQMHPITWKGAQWEYLVEYPKDIQYIDPERFEEILDTAGQHGWRLVEVSHEAHFYAFYFSRELLTEKLAANTARLKAYKAYRASKESDIITKVLAAQKEKEAYEQQYAVELAKVNQALQTEVNLEQKALQLEQQQKQLMSTTMMPATKAAVPATALVPSKK